MVRKGVWRGSQRWFCRKCKHYFTGHRERDFHALFQEYLSGKQTLAQLAEKHNVSVSTIQRRLRTIHSTRMISKDKDVVVLMDTTYWGRDFGVVMLYDCYRKKLLWRKFVNRKEVVADYLEGIGWLEKYSFKIYGIVCDGLKGLAKSLARYKVQYCQFHQVKTVCSYLTRKPQTEAGKELRKIALLLCHTDKESFEGMLNEWYCKWGEWIKERSFDPQSKRDHYIHRKVRAAYFSLKRNSQYLWTFYDYPDSHLPNTNNCLEAVNTDLKTKLRVHNGLNKRNRMIFIDEYFRQKIQPKK